MGCELRARRPPVARPCPVSRRAGLVVLNALALAQARAFAPDAILCGHIVVAPAAVLLGRVTGAPVVTYLYADEGPAQPRLARLAFRSSAATIAVSRYAGELAIELGAPSERVVVIEPGVDLAGRAACAAIRGAADRHGRALDRPLQGSRRHARSAADHPRAGARRALGRGRRRIAATGARSARDRSGRRRCRAVHGRGRRCGARRLARSRARLRHAEPVAAGRRGRRGLRDRLPRGGRARGVPVVAGAVAGALDAVVDGETGLLVDPRSPAAVADAVAGLLLDPALAVRFGEAGARRAAEYSWPRMVARVEDVLLGVIAAHEGPVSQRHEPRQRRRALPARPAPRARRRRRAARRLPARAAARRGRALGIAVVPVRQRPGACACIRCTRRARSRSWRAPRSPCGGWRRAAGRPGPREHAAVVPRRGGRAAARRPPVRRLRPRRAERRASRTAREPGDSRAASVLFANSAYSADRFGIARDDPRRRDRLQPDRPRRRSIPARHDAGGGPRGGWSWAATTSCSR